MAAICWLLYPTILQRFFGIHSLLFFKHSLNEIGTLLFQMLQIIVKCSHYPSAPFEQYSHFFTRERNLYFDHYHLERRIDKQALRQICALAVSIEEKW